MELKLETNHHLVLKMERWLASCFVKTWIRSCWLWRLRLHWCQAGQPANVGVNRFSQPILPLGVSRGYEENIPTHEPRGNYRITAIFVLFFVDPSTCWMRCSFGEVWWCVFWRELQDLDRFSKMWSDKMIFMRHTLQGTNISHLEKRKIIFRMPFLGDMLVPWRVDKI